MSENVTQPVAPIPPPWANSHLHKQKFSQAAQAAQNCRNVLTQVPESGTFLNDPARNNLKRAATPEKKYREPLDPQTALVYDAFLQLSVVNVPIKRFGVLRILKSEKAELLAATAAATGHADIDPDAAPPRSCAVTLLIRDSSKCTHKATLLNCVAYLAHYGGAERAAKDVRFSVLMDDDALAYGVNHGQGPKDNVEIALVYATPDAVVTMAKIELPWKDSGRKLFKLFKMRTIQLFELVSINPPPSLMRVMDGVGSETVADAYVNSMQSANDDFWARLSTHSPSPSLDHKLDFHILENVGAFLKIVPTWVMDTPEGIAHPLVSFGILFYRKGMHEETKEFLVKARESQLARFEPPPPPDWPIGLRYADQDMTEKSLGLHVLQVTSDFVSFKGEISCFGMVGSPGHRVCVYDGATMLRLVYSLLPFEIQHYNNNFVFPCTQDHVNTQNDSVTRAQWDATCAAVRKYWHCVYYMDPDEEAPPSPFALSQSRAEPSEEDRALSQIVGTPSFYGAFRVGDVYEQISKPLQPPMPALSAFLVSACARLGPAASMSQALNECVRLREAHEAEIKSLHSELAQLQTAPPPPTLRATAETGPYKYGIVSRIIAGMGLEKGVGYGLKMPMTGGRIKVIVSVLAAAKGLALSEGAIDAGSDAEWGKQNCGDMTAVEAIAAIGSRLYDCPIVIIAQDERSAFSFLKVRGAGGAGEVTTRCISAVDALELSIPKTAIFVLHKLDGDKLWAISSPRPKPAGS